MKHFYIKSLILAVLIALVFGVCFRFVKGTESNMADSATAYNLSAWLSKNGVSIDKDIIDLSTKHVIYTTMYNTVSDRKASAERILGEGITSSADTYRGANGAVVFTDDTFKLTPADGLFDKIVSGVDKYNSAKKAERIVKELGFDIKGSIISGGVEDERFVANITKTINSMPVFDDSISVYMDKNKVISIEGIWYVPESGKVQKRKAKSAADALTELAHQIGGGEKNTITSMTLGYKLKHTDHITELEPVWRFEINNDDIIYIGA